MHTHIFANACAYYLQELERYDLILKKDGRYRIIDKVVKDYFVAMQV